MGFDLYFAGVPLESYAERMFSLGVTKVLFSYITPSTLPKWLSALKEFRIPGKQYKLMIDSGAFSAWNSGVEVNLDEYIKFLLDFVPQVGKEGVEVHPVSLDVIPGRAGETKQLSDDEILWAAKQGLENLRRMKEAGVEGVIHVYHQGEPLSWLDKIVEEVDYVGISPANDLHEGHRIRWVEFVFNYMEKNGYKIKTHGFAATGWKMMMAVPWTSCDSITYRLSAFYGSVYVPRYGYDDERSYEEPPYRVAISERLSEGGVYLDWASDVLAATGLSKDEVASHWFYRMMVNVKYFLQLEKHINLRREHHLQRKHKGFFF